LFLTSGSYVLYDLRRHYIPKGWPSLAPCVGRWPPDIFSSSRVKSPPGD
jgi:hypothetical protein